MAHGTSRVASSTKATATVAVLDPALFSAKGAVQRATFHGNRLPRQSEVTQFPAQQHHVVPTHVGHYSGQPSTLQAGFGAHYQQPAYVGRPPHAHGTIQMGYASPYIQQNHGIPPPNQYTSPTKVPANTPVRAPSAATPAKAPAKAANTPSITARSVLPVASNVPAEPNAAPKTKFLKTSLSTSHPTQKLSTPATAA